MKIIKLTKEELHHFFEYDNITGAIIWKVTRQNTLKGTVASSKTEYGNWVGLLRSKYKTDRLIWIMHNGTDPGKLEHINGDIYDDRIENLRKKTPPVTRMRYKTVQNLKRNDSKVIAKDLYWFFRRNCPLPTDPWFLHFGQLKHR